MPGVPLPAVIVGDDADLVLMACVSWRRGLYVANAAMDDEKQLHDGMQVNTAAAARAYPGQAGPCHHIAVC